MFICVHLWLIMKLEKFQPAFFLLLHSPYPLLLNLIACAQLLYMRAEASVVVGCCRWRVWLLKYIIYEILHRKERKVKVTMSLRTLRSLR